MQDKKGMKIIDNTIVWIIITYKGKVPVHTKKACMGVEVYSHLPLSLVPDYEPAFLPLGKNSGAH